LICIKRLRRDLGLELLVHPMGYIYISFVFFRVRILVSMEPIEVPIGGSYRCFVIAEIGQNHQGDEEIAKELITAAKVNWFI